MFLAIRNVIESQLQLIEELQKENQSLNADLKAFVVYLYYACRITENKMVDELFSTETGFVIKRKISNGTISEDGRTAWENMMPLMDNCRKLGVSFFEYIRDIFSGKYTMTRLTHLISPKAF